MSFSAALLAGGHSSRMGRDKAFLEIDGVPLWQRQLRTLQDLHLSRIFVSGPAHAEWIEAGLEVVPDVVADRGPLAGLVSVLHRCTTSHLLALAVDLPNMTRDYLRSLIASSLPDKGIIPKNEERFEPLAAVYPLSCLPLVETLLRDKNGSLQALAVRAIGQQLMLEKQISPEDKTLFFNLNTPQDLLLTERSLRVRMPNESTR